MARSLLLHAALAAAALALRMPSEDDPAFLAEGAGKLAAVPTIRKFHEVWSQRYASEKHLWEPMPSSVQLVLGLFTVAPDFQYREVVRKTWLNQMGVCYWQSEPKEGCSVYVAFVIGNGGMGEHLGRWRHLSRMSPEEVERTHKEKGMLVLDTPENMNSDKSPVWFDTARRLFPWATHVGKTDMDTYPFLHKLVHRMEAGRGCSLGQSPYEIIGRPHDWLGPVFENVCGGDSCPQFTSDVDHQWPAALPGRSWRFVSGELYALSMPLVQQIDWTTPVPTDHEDLSVTLQMSRAARDKGFCVVLRRLDAWFHKRYDSNASYANDMEG